MSGTIIRIYLQGMLEVIAGSSGFADFDEEVAEACSTGRVFGMLCNRQFIDPAGLRNLSRGEEEVAEIVQRADVRRFVFEYVGIYSASFLGSTGLLKETSSLKREGSGLGIKLQLLFYR